MPVFFWTASLLRGPLSLGLRLFDGEDAAPLPVKQPSVLQCSPFALAREKATACKTNDGGAADSIAPEVTRTVGQPPPLRALAALVEYFPDDRPLPLALAAAHPFLRCYGERCAGLLLPHAHTVQRWCNALEAPAVDMGGDTLLQQLASDRARYGLLECDDCNDTDSCTGGHSAASQEASRSEAVLVRMVEAGSLPSAIRALIVGQYWLERPLHPADPPLPWRLHVDADADAGHSCAAGERVLADAALGAVLKGIRAPVTQIRAAGAPWAAVRSLADPTLRSLVHLAVPHCAGLEDLGVFACLPALATLDASHSGARVVGALGASATLRTVVLRGCRALQSVSAFGDAAVLEHLVASQSGVYDVTGLARSRSLRTIRLYGCVELIDLRPLGGLVSLVELHASGSGADTVDELCTAPRLQRLYLRYCGLTDVRALGAASRLRVLSLSSTAIASVDPLQRCTALVALYVCGCARLRSLAPLGSCPQLRAIDAAGSGVESVAGLHRAPRLARLCLTNCRRLTDLADLGRSCSLTTLLLSSSALARLEGLAGCPQLRCLDVSYCKDVEDWHVLQGLPHLEALLAEGCTARAMPHSSI